MVLGTHFLIGHPEETCCNQTDERRISLRIGRRERDKQRQGGRGTSMTRGRLELADKQGFPHRDEQIDRVTGARDDRQRGRLQRGIQKTWGVQRCERGIARFLFISNK